MEIRVCVCVYMCLFTDIFPQDNFQLLVKVSRVPFATRETLTLQTFPTRAPK